MTLRKMQKKTFSSVAEVLLSNKKNAQSFCRFTTMQSDWTVQKGEGAAGLAPVWHYCSIIAASL